MITGTAGINGAGLYHEASGRGHPLVLIRDGLLDGRIWNEQFEAFSGGYRTIRYDRRGHGRSRSPGGEFSHVEDLCALLGSLNVGRAHLLGSSDGGRIAVDFALEYPGMASSLILAAPNLGGYRLSDERQREISEIFLAAREEGASRAAEMSLGDPFWSPDRKRTVVRQKLRGLLIEAFHNFLRSQDLREQRHSTAARRLSEISAPALVILGERDSPDNRAIADTLVAGIPGAEKAMICPAPRTCRTWRSPKSSIGSRSAF